MKTLIDYANQHNLKVVVVNYHGWGKTNKGYDLINPKNSQIIVALEPYKLGKNNWYFRDVHKNYNGERYFPKISKKMFADINPQEQSFFINSTFKNTKKLN